MMSNETKRDVFDELLKMYRNSMALTHEEPVILDNDGYDVFGKIEKSYDAALPDDLPVIPKAVGEYIKDNKDLDLLVALTIASNGYKHSELWIAMHQNVFSLAWVLEAWIVEETGEIVKVEEEK